jgi:hypothetical protein
MPGPPDFCSAKRVFEESTAGFLPIPIIFHPEYRSSIT